MSNFDSKKLNSDHYFQKILAQVYEKKVFLKQIYLIPKLWFDAV